MHGYFRVVIVRRLIINSNKQTNKHEGQPAPRTTTILPISHMLLLANLAWAYAAVVTIVAEGAAGAREDHRPSRYTQQQNSLVQMARESLLQHSMTSQQQQQQQQQQEHRGGALFELCESVSAHGAKGDGVTDDTAAFQAAAAVVVRNAEVVRIPPLPLARSLCTHLLDLQTDPQTQFTPKNNNPRFRPQQGGASLFLG
jgi:hypothetical protein